MDWLLIAADTANAAEPGMLAVLGLKAWTIFKVAAGLGFVIFVHELGHFLVAKACGVKCEKFYVGFDVPLGKIFGWTIPAKLFHFTWGETEYGIGILPLGGYVKMLGQDDDPRNTEAEIERSKAVAKVEKDGEVLSPDEFVDHDYGPLDPRSFPAKSVPARMAIISAGVIMNVIFAVILAAIAYRVGVPYEPAIIGDTFVGSPAWNAGWRPGDKIVQVGRAGAPDENLRFVEDLRKRVIFHGTKTDLDFLIKHADGTEDWSKLRPVVIAPNRYGTLGIAPGRSLKIATRVKELAHLEPKSSEPLKAGDKIVAVNGEPITHGWELTQVMARNPAEPLKLSLERPAADLEKNKDAPPTKLEIEIAPRAMRTVGIVPKLKGISGVRPNSPAEKAGVKAGDKLLEIDGEPVGNPLTLGQRLLSKVGREVTLKLGRGAETIDAAVTPVAPQIIDETQLPQELVGVDALGLALETEDVIAAVESGSPAEKAGLLPGDTLMAAELENKDDKIKAEDLDNTFYLKKKPYDFTEAGFDWPLLHEALQAVHDSTELKLTVKRGADAKTVVLAPVEATDHFDATHGLRTAGLSEVRVVDNVPDAFRLGVRETWERLSEVVTTLSMLVTGKISPSDLSGPVGILTVAGHQASIGISKLLIFLTLLSANLAVINFLPIPALDGGHMLFLTAEGIRGKPVDPNLQMRLTIGGILALLSLMVFATFMDFSRLLSG